MKRRVVGVLALVAGIMVLYTASAVAQQSASADYSVDEVFFGTGGELEACSTDYCSKQAAGELAAGETASNDYRAQAGFNTNREEYLEFIVNGVSTDLGYLGETYTSYTSATFSVKAYLAHGYSVINAGDPPETNDVTPHVMTALTTPTTAQTGVEQFGINLVDNSSPNIGANRTQDPDNTFSFGEPTTDYDNVNQFKYVKGDAIASSTRSTGQTTYTVSYIYNIAPNTVAGTYTFNHDMVAVGTY